MPLSVAQDGMIITMRQVKVRVNATPMRECTIYIGSGTIEKIGTLYDLKRYSKIFVVSDKSVKPLLNKLLAALPPSTTSVILPVGEKQKSIRTIQKIWTAMHDAGCDRQSLVINLGGGVVGDMGGFAASTYMRGVEFLNVPTSLLAQVDASVGGKTGFNFDGIKNLIGTFDQPIGVLVDLEALADLPDREFISGFGEIIKHGLIWDKDHFMNATSKPPRKFTQKELTDIITQSIQIKTEIMQGDETEGGIRKLLNYGHTIGHAVEALSLETNKPLLHGEAVSIGMRAEALIAERQGLLARSDRKLIERALIKAGLPTTDSASAVSILGKMQSDKKNRSGELNFTLPDGIGRALYDQKVPSSLLRDVLKALSKKSS